MNSRPVILCVDDEKSVLSTLKQQLSTDLQEVYEIEIAESADEALEVLEELREDGLKIAAVISDQIMPGMKGDELLIEIHGSDPDIPKILLTGQASLIAVQNAINNAGLYRYISKPWERNDLTMTVAQAAKSYLQKEKIDFFDQSIKVLKNINDSTRKLSSQIKSEDLANAYITMISEQADFEVCMVVFKNGEELMVQGYNHDGSSKKILADLSKEQKEELSENTRKYNPEEEGYKENRDSAVLSLKSRDKEDYGFVYVKNKGKEPIAESQFEMFKILTKQLIVSYETAGLYQNIEKQKKVIERKNKNIMNSLDYAQKIQTSLLSNHEIVEQYFSDFFVWYRPRDIVSGDFYLFRDLGDHLFIICSDCTGHGVPGAFITILGRMIIRELVVKGDIIDPSVILKELDARILDIFHKHGESEIRDGMDISVLVYDKNTKKFTFSGAKSTIYCVKGGELIKYKGSKYEIGNYMFKDVKDKFETIDLDLQSGDSIYMFSDGFQDQFGGPSFSKIGPRKFQELIITNKSEPMAKQQEIITDYFKGWKAENAQTDDLLMMGLRV